MDGNSIKMKDSKFNEKRYSSQGHTPTNGTLRMD